jgi:PemK-like, MazF-like toxin of type II toxin-antitoxin system
MLNIPLVDYGIDLAETAGGPARSRQPLCQDAGDLPRRGTEPGKTRSVLVVQAQTLIDASHPSTLIIPLTTNLIDDAEPLRIRVEAPIRTAARFRPAH